MNEGAGSGGRSTGRIVVAVVVVMVVALGAIVGGVFVAWRARRGEGTRGASPIAVPFERVAARDEHGGLTREGALAAFAVMFGGMPGVSVPRSVTGVPACGTEVVQRVLGESQSLTQAQRDRLGLVLSGRRPPDLRAQVLSLRGWTGHQHDVVRRAMETARETFNALTGHTLNDKVVVRLVDEDVPDPSMPRSPAFAVPAPDDALDECARRDACRENLYRSWVGAETASSFNGCFIFVGRDALSFDDADLTATVAHELFHCYQLDAITRREAAGGRWRTEGACAFMGELVASRLFPSSRTVRYADWWTTWIGGQTSSEDGRPLGGFAHYRADYSAVALLSALDRAGALRFPQLLDLPLFDDHAAFAALTQGHNDVLGRLATSALRRREWGSRWYFDASSRVPELPDHHRRPEPPTRLGREAPRAQVETSEAVERLWAFEVAGNVDVLLVNATGRPHGGGIFDQAHDSALYFDGPGERAWCHRTGGCECPAGRRSAHAPPGANVPPTALNFSLAAMGPAGTQGRFELTAMTLEEWCNATDDAGVPDAADGASDELDPCLRGSWRLDIDDYRAQIEPRVGSAARIDRIGGSETLDFVQREGVVHANNLCVEMTAAGLRLRVITSGTSTADVSTRAGRLRSSRVRNALSFNTQMRMGNAWSPFPAPVTFPLAALSADREMPYTCSPSRLELHAEGGVVLRYGR